MSIITTNINTNSIANNSIPLVYTIFKVLTTYCMATNLIVNNNSFEFPTEGENPPWGSDVTDWASAVTDVLGTLASTTDILNSQFALNASVASPTALNGLYFNPNQVRSATIEYTIYRASSSDKTETGIITISNTGSGFSLVRESNADVGIDFSIDNTGQIKYASNRQTGASVLTCRARTFGI